MYSTPSHTTWHGGDGDYATQALAESSGGTRANRARSDSAAAPAPVQAQYARAEAAPSVDDGGGAHTRVAEPSAQDARDTTGLLLIYRATITLAIYDVRSKLEEAVALAETLGGYASERTSTSVVLRIPAERFRESLDRISALGDVLSLDWSAQNVTEEFHDTEIRLHNALEMRTRLIELLNAAESVPDILAIESEIERLTLEIERYRGRIRLLSDQLAYSTVTLHFSVPPTTSIPGDAFRLPFRWVRTLGLGPLLSL